MRKQSDRSEQCGFYLTDLLAPKRMSLTNRMGRRKTFQHSKRFEKHSDKMQRVHLDHTEFQNQVCYRGTTGGQQVLSGNVHFLAVVLASGEKALIGSMRAEASGGKVS